MYIQNVDAQPDSPRDFAECRLSRSCQTLIEGLEHLEAPWGIKGIAACVQGKHRESNQDYIGFKVHPGGIIIAVVADGMSGTDDGGTAGRCLRDGIMEKPTSFWDGMKASQTMMKDAKLAKNVFFERRTAGSCFAACKIQMDDHGEFSVVPFHVGDSRCAVIDHDGTVSFETQDHNIAADLVRLGTLKPEEARVSPRRHSVYAAVYPHKVLGDEYLPQKEKEEKDRMTLPSGSFVYIASDGVTCDVPPALAGKLLSQNKFDLEKTLGVISRMTANSKDNQSIILLRIPQSSPPASSDMQEHTTQASTGVRQVLSGKNQ